MSKDPISEFKSARGSGPGSEPDLSIRHITIYSDNQCSCIEKPDPQIFRKNKITRQALKVIPGEVTVVPRTVYWITRISTVEGIPGDGSCKDLRIKSARCAGIVPGDLDTGAVEQ